MYQFIDLRFFFRVLALAVRRNQKTENKRST